MRTAIGSLLIVLATCGLALADPGLKGLSSIKIYVSGIDKDAEECGIKKADVETSAQLPLRAYTRVKIGDGTLGPVLSIKLTVLKSKSFCVTSINFDVEQYMSVRLPYQSENYFATVTIFQTGHIQYTPNSQQNTVPQIVEGMARDLALAWQRQNPN